MDTLYKTVITLLCLPNLTLPTTITITIAGRGVLLTDFWTRQCGGEDEAGSQDDIHLGTVKSVISARQRAVCVEEDVRVTVPEPAADGRVRSDCGRPRTSGYQASTVSEIICYIIRCPK